MSDTTFTTTLTSRKERDAGSNSKSPGGALADNVSVTAEILITPHSALVNSNHNMSPFTQSTLAFTPSAQVAKWLLWSRVATLSANFISTVDADERCFVVAHVKEHTSEKVLRRLRRKATHDVKCLLKATTAAEDNKDDTISKSVTSTNALVGGMRDHDDAPPLTVLQLTESRLRELQNTLEAARHSASEHLLSKEDLLPGLLTSNEVTALANGDISSLEEVLRQRQHQQQKGGSLGGVLSASDGEGSMYSGMSGDDADKGGGRSDVGSSRTESSSSSSSSSESSSLGVGSDDLQALLDEEEVMMMGGGGEEGSGGDDDPGSLLMNKSARGKGAGNKKKKPIILDGFVLLPVTTDNCGDRHRRAYSATSHTTTSNVTSPSTYKNDPSFFSKHSPLKFTPETFFRSDSSSGILSVDEYTPGFFSGIARTTRTQVDRFLCGEFGINQLEIIDKDPLLDKNNKKKQSSPNFRTTTSNKNREAIGRDNPIVLEDQDDDDDEYDGYVEPLDVDDEDAAITDPYNFGRHSGIGSNSSMA
jgi:hypothetical protein